MGLLNLPPFAPTVTPDSAWELLNIYPVGTEDARSAWEADLQHMRDEAVTFNITEEAGGVTESSRTRFKKIRRELREAGLPLFKRSLISENPALNSLWTTIFGTGNSSRNVDDVGTADLIKLAHSPYAYVPDIIVDELVKRYREAIDPQIHEALLHLVNSNPLRLSSVLGLAFYFEIFESVREPAVRQRMISRLIDNGEVDGRIIPMLRKIACVHPEDFTAEQAPTMLALLSKYPALFESYTERSPRIRGTRHEGLLQIFAGSPDILPRLFEELFDNNGRLARKPSLAKQVWAAMPQPRQSALLSRLLDAIGDRGGKRWKEYGMARFASRTGHLFPYNIDDLHDLAEGDGEGWRKYSTPILVDILVFLEEHPSYTASSRTSALAREIQRHLLSVRRSHFEGYTEIFKQRPFNRSALMAALYSEMEESPAPGNP